MTTCPKSWYLWAVPRWISIDDVERVLNSLRLQRARSDQGGHTVISNLQTSYVINTGESYRIIPPFISELVSSMQRLYVNKFCQLRQLSLILNELLYSIMLEKKLIHLSSSYGGDISEHRCKESKPKSIPSCYTALFLEFYKSTFIWVEYD